MVLKETQQPVEVDMNLTLAVADTYLSVEIQLPVAIQQGLVFDIDLIEFLLTPSPDPVAAGNVEQGWQLTLNEQTSILAYTNNDVIAAYTRTAHASAALLHSGFSEFRLHNNTVGRANLIAKDSIFLGMDTLNVTVVAVLAGRIIGSIVALKEKALTQLLLGQL